MDSDVERKALPFFDETLPLVSCKEVVHKDPVHSVNAAVQHKFEIELAEVACQSLKRKEREVQVDLDEKSADEKISIDPVRFQKFIGRIEPFINHFLHENSEKPNVLKNIKFKYSSEENAQELFQLNHVDVNKEKTLQVTGLSWSANGSSICVAYGHTSHDGLCIHKGAVCSWNIERYKINPNKADVCIETSLCVTAIACHPERPGIVAGGLYNGEIFVWDLREQEPFVARILERQDLHRDLISSLQWIREPKLSKKKFLLLSTSQDGKILLWNPLPSKNNLKLSEAFFICTKSNTGKSSGKSIGVNAISFNIEDAETFVFGCDSGAIHKGSLSSVQSVHSREEGLAEMSVEAKNPTQINYQSHDSPVYSVAFSPFHRHLFLSCSHDGQIRIYSQLFENCGQCFAPGQGAIFCCRWSPSRPLLIAAGSERGGALIFDLEPKENAGATFFPSAPVENLPASDPNASILCLEFNPKQANLLACADSTGIVLIWKLTERFTTAQNDEIENLQNLAKTFSDGI